MLRNIVGLYVSWNDPKKAIRIKWIENAIAQSGDYFEDALVKAIQPVYKGV